MSVAPTPFDSVLSALDAVPAETFRDAPPFPHIFFDGLFDPALIAQIHGLFPALPDDYWQKNNDHGIEVKWRSNWRSEYDIPEPAREVVRFLNSGPMLRALARLTGIPHLIADPYYTGGGFNYIRRGGHLDVHVDGNWHDAMQVHRRLNLILYLNPAWRQEWGGQLKLYDDPNGEAKAFITPFTNRLFVFETHDYSFHGHPDALQCPEDEGRSSIILYYYTTAPRPEIQVQESRPHSALWRSRNWTDKRGEKARV
jgi:hypothetical protein